MSSSFVAAVSYLQFQQTVGHCPLNDGDDPGCGWYVTTDRRYAASLHLDAATEQWRYVVYHGARGDWSRTASRMFDELTDAEDALHREITKLADWKSVTLIGDDQR